jgi:hypothetical protein
MCVSVSEATELLFKVALVRIRVAMEAKKVEWGVIVAFWSWHRAIGKRVVGTEW